MRLTKVFFILCVLLIVFSSTVFADNPVTVGDISVVVTGDTVSVTTPVGGYTTNMAFAVKVVSMSGQVEFIDTVHVSNGSIYFSFVPLEAIEGDVLIIKITGVTTITKTFVYSEVGTNDKRLSKVEQDALDYVKGLYKDYEDVLGTIEFDWVMSTSSEYALLTLRATNITSYSNVWVNKDEARWETYIDEILYELSKRLDREVRIYVLDSDKKSLYNKKIRPGEAEAAQIAEILKNMNNNFSTMVIGGVSYPLIYSRSDINSDDRLLYVDVLCSNMGSNWSVKEESGLIDFLDSVWESVKDSYVGDITFRVYGSERKLHNTYSYFNDASFTHESKYGPLDVSRGSFPIELFNYGKNAYIVPSSSIGMKISGSEVDIEVSDVAAITKGLAAIKGDEQKQLVVGVDPPVSASEISVTLSAGVASAIKASRAALIINTPLYQFNISYEGIPSNAGIICFVKRLDDEYVMGENITASDKPYEMSIKTTGGEDLYGLLSTPITGVLRVGTDISTLVKDMRYASIFKKPASSEFEWIQINSGWRSNLQGIVFTYTGAGVYGTAEKIVVFSDMEEHWALPAVSVAASKGIIDGVGYGLFKPQSPITRAEFAALMAKHLGITPKTSGYYSDVASGDWFFEYVNACRDYDVLPPTMTLAEFNPQEPISREEMCYMTVRAYMLATNLPVTPSYILFEDAYSVSSWAKDYVSIAAEKGIIKGVPGNKVLPQNGATRAEAAQILYNLLVAEGAF